MTTRLLPPLSGLLLLSHAALAWETPKSVSPSSPVCSVVYDPNDSVQVRAEPGKTLAIEFGDNRTVQVLAVSDKVHLKWLYTRNMLWLKATDEVQAQPLSVRVMRDDGKSELYMMQWMAKDDGSGPACDLIRYINPQDDMDARKAEADKRREAWEAGAASRALHKAAIRPHGPGTGPSLLNRAYTIGGDVALMPAELAPTPPAVVPVSPVTTAAAGGAK